MLRLNQRTSVCILVTPDSDHDKFQHNMFACWLAGWLAGRRQACRRAGMQACRHAGMQAGRQACRHVGHWHEDTCTDVRRERRADMQACVHDIDTSTANLRTKILDVRGFDSSIILVLRVGTLMSMGSFPKPILSQQNHRKDTLSRKVGCRCPCTCHPHLEDPEQ